MFFNVWCWKNFRPQYWSSHEETANDARFMRISADSYLECVLEPPAISVSTIPKIGSLTFFFKLLFIPHLGLELRFQVLKIQYQRNFESLNSLSDKRLAKGYPNIYSLKLDFESKCYSRTFLISLKRSLNHEINIWFFTLFINACQ